LDGILPCFQIVLAPVSFSFFNDACGEKSL